MSVRTYFMVLLLSGLTPALAEDPRRVSTAARQSSAEVDDIGEISESSKGSTDPKGGPKEALPPEQKRFRLNVGIRPQFTSNAQLSGDHKSGDFLVMPNIEAGYKLPFGESGFALDTVARIDSGLYARYDERTFLSYSLQTTFEYRPKAYLPRVFIGAEPYRLDGFDGQGRITQAVALSAGTDWGYGFNNGNSLAFIGYTFTDHLSDPKRDSRINHAVTVGYSQVLAPKLVGQVYYQYQHDNYQDFSRDDDRHIAGITLTYQLDRHFFATLGGSFVDNDSTQAKASYQSAGVSVGLNYQY